MSKSTAQSHPANWENERYDRHTLIPGWHQESLARAMVIVIGMGALGNEVARILAMSGVGELVICDPDMVERSNLSRTVLFRESDIGKFKVQAAAHALTDLAPGITVQPRPWPLVNGVGLAELRGASLMLGCLDTQSARLQLAGRCQLSQAPYIDGGTHPWGGEVRPYLDPAGPCFGCSLSKHQRSVVDAPWSCLDTTASAPTGSAAPASALVGAWMAILAVRFLMGLNCPEDTLSIDATCGTTRLVSQQRDAECPLHDPMGSVIKVGVGRDDPIGKLRSVLPRDSVPLAWDAVQYRVECPRCGFDEARWGLPSAASCPRCQNALRLRTTLELDQAPEDLPLATFGIAPREILAVRYADKLQWVELEA